ncbi:MAG: branched-chain amino acid ABC transporter permease [Firmicutes bacterium]|nr:branched-chain amino acid ABC transporter permease [Bacillota bacterium]MDH7494738.1 branched-chain amino acid ABC transporter permease [Bacillota bacterium]
MRPAKKETVNGRAFPSTGGVAGKPAGRQAERPGSRDVLEFLIIGGCFVALAPLLRAHRVTDFMIFCIFTLSFDLLYGYMGRLSFGHLLFLGAGAYGAGLFLRHVTSNPLLAILLGMSVACLLAMIVGLVTVRATGACFALINLAFNQTGWFLVMSPLRKVTGGQDGFGVEAARLGWIDFGDAAFRFWFVLVILLLMFFLLKRLMRSPYGILVRSIKEDETRVRFLGYNTYLYKWITFVISASVAGLSGALTALNYGYVNPNTMDVHKNVGAVFACLIGGAGHLYGALVGGVVYMIISNFLPVYIRRWEMFLGAALLVVVFRFRRGIWGSLEPCLSRAAAGGRLRTPPDKGALVK